MTVLPKEQFDAQIKRLVTLHKQHKTLGVTVNDIKKVVIDSVEHYGKQKVSDRTVFITERKTWKYTTETEDLMAKLERLKKEVDVAQKREQKLGIAILEGTKPSLTVR